MKKLLFTFFISLFFVGFVNAKEWNISSDAFKSLGSIVKDTTIDGLTIKASAEKTVVVDENAKSLGDISFTNRLKLGGAGTYTDGVASARVLSFEVAGKTKITVAAMSSTASENRLLNIVLANGDTLAQFPARGDSLTSAEYLYEGDATTIYLFSAASGINIYSLKSEVVEEPVVGPIVGVSKDANCIFDPAAVNADLLPEGMSIVEINGKKMLQVVVNGWNSILNVPEFKFEPGMTAFTEFKYKVGQKEYTADKINACVQIMDTINKMTVSWSTDLQTTTTGLTQSNPSGEFVKVKANAASTSKFAHQVQFFGQQTASWGAVVGDTLWVGKVRAYKVDEKCIFDPATYDPDDLADGMEVVDINGKKMLQVVVNGWNSTLNVPAFKFEPGMTAYATFKYVVGQKEYAADKINACVQIMDTINKMTVSWSTDLQTTTTGLVQSNPSGNFVATSAAAAKTSKFAHQVQFFGQQTASWGAVVGDTLWVGKVRAYATDATCIFDPETYDPDNLKPGMEIVKIGSKKYLKVIVDGWNSTLDVPEFKVKEGMKAHTEFEYNIGQTKFTASQINAAVQMIDTINKTTVSWSTEPVNSTTGLVQSAPTGEMKEVTASFASGMNLVHQVQFFGQETSSWGAVAGDTLICGRVGVIESAAITFIVDDSNLKTSTGFALKGSWLKATGEYDKNWDGGNEVAKFYDDGTHGDKTAGDNKWTVTINLMVDNGVNSWEWGVNDAKGKWLYGNFKFTVADAKAQTLTYANTVSAKNLGASTIKVYPNPASSMLNVLGEVNSVEIYNLTGAKVLVSNSNHINVSSLAKGTYIAKVNGANGETSMSKFCKE